MRGKPLSQMRIGKAQELSPALNAEWGIVKH